MIKFVCFMAGLLLGGCLGVVMLCCLRINRDRSNEREIRWLHNELDSKKE